MTDHATSTHPWPSAIFSVSPAARSRCRRAGWPRIPRFRRSGRSRAGACRTGRGSWAGPARRNAPSTRWRRHRREPRRPAGSGRPAAQATRAAFRLPPGGAERNPSSNLASGNQALDRGRCVGPRCPRGELALYALAAAPDGGPSRRGAVATSVPCATQVETSRPSGVTVCGFGRMAPPPAHDDGHRARKTPNRPNRSWSPRQR
jgi:hypothetical protein